ncbi:hypothetical protein EMIT0P2_30530 [Pseudomonas sp. IT-P2]
MYASIPTCKVEMVQLDRTIRT